jgi:polyphosphate kinase 2 (PPK2 family)
VAIPGLSRVQHGHLVPAADARIKSGHDGNMKHVITGLDPVIHRRCTDQAGQGGNMKHVVTGLDPVIFMLARE